MKKIKGIIVGAGRAGADLHYGALKVNGADIIALVDVREEHVRNESKRLRIPHYYTSLEKALKEHEVDFVSVCTNVDSHLETALLALRHGSHVLMEKPMTNNIDEANVLADAIKKSGKTVSVVHNHKFYPSIQKAKKIIKNGEIGEIIHIHREMTFKQESTGMMEEGHWAHDIPGGRLFEANPHNLYLLYNFVGKFDLLNIYPRKISKKYPYAKIDEFFANFSTKKTTISLKVSMHSEKEIGTSFFIIGTKNSLLVTYADIQFLGDLIPRGRIYKRLPEIISNSIITRLKKFPKIYNAEMKQMLKNKVNIGMGSGHYYYMKSYLSFLNGNTEIPVSWEEAYFTEAMNERMGVAVEKIINDTQAS